MQIAPYGIKHVLSYSLAPRLLWGLCFIFVFIIFLIFSTLHVCIVLFIFLHLFFILFLYLFCENIWGNSCCRKSCMVSSSNHQTMRVWGKNTSLHKTIKDSFSIYTLISDVTLAATMKQYFLYLQNVNTTWRLKTCHKIKEMWESSTSVFYS